MASVDLNVNRFEVTSVYTHPDARVDIVLVHGLNGHPKKTWTAKNNVFWPATLLPGTIRDHPANILVYGYNADVYSRSNNSSASKDFIFQHAQTLVTHLTSYRRSVGSSSRPIIWVAHSLGGILVKRALLFSNDVQAADHEPYRSIYISTYGIIFLGTPHTGSGVAAWGHVLQAMSDAVVPKKFFESESVLLKTLKSDNERLQEINNHFLDIYQRFKIHMVHENHKTDLKGTKALIVDADSASPQLPGVTYYGVEATHSTMCKFDSTNAPGYRTVSMAILDWIVDAPEIIALRWAVEAEDREARLRREINERRCPYASMERSPVEDTLAKSDGTAGDARPLSLLPPIDGVTDAATPLDPSLPFAASVTPVVSAVIAATTKDAQTSPMPLTVFDAEAPNRLPQDSDSTTKPDTIFLHPEPFRPNAYFIGRDRELEELHQKLTDTKRRAEGTSAVLIQALPGGGKTHLARQYVFSHRADYPGGIYWVRAKTMTEMEQFYWRMAKNEPLRELVHAALKQKRSASDASQAHPDLIDAHNFVDTVRHWFKILSDWLIVFDGIRFDASGVQRFIPDAKNTSLIYTSTGRSAAGEYTFNSPQIMELSLLRPQHASQLLLLEMEKRQPWSQDDQANALELVQLMGRLPVMIHVAARHLKATREPLTRYLRTYRSRPRAGDLTAYRVIWKELKSRGANPALNLISILAFYDNWIPVGMVVLGLSALDKRTPVMTRDASHKVRSLNNSLKLLIAFGLVERTESDNLSPTSSQSTTSSKRSFEKSHEFVDILRIHSVVHAFLVDILAEEKEHNFWLERSAAVFCRSFDAADSRIQEDVRLGLPDDYRRLVVHGKKLLEHLARGERKAGSSQDLATVRAAVEERLQRCQNAIERSAQAYIVSSADATLAEDSVLADVSLASVFERTNSLSESDSASPSSVLSQAGSAPQTRRGTGLLVMGADAPGNGMGKEPVADPWFVRLDGDDDDGTNSGNAHLASFQPLPIEFPSSSQHHRLDKDNPYHWHIPYPTHDSTIPAPALLNNSDGWADSPTPQASSIVWGPQNVPGRPAHSRLSISTSSSTADDWKSFRSSHRTIRKNEDRRYHDRAGAWRDMSVSDPRISISREVVQASAFVLPSNSATSSPSSAHGGALPSGSGAQIALGRLGAMAQLRSASSPKAATEKGPNTSPLSQYRQAEASSGPKWRQQQKQQQQRQQENDRFNDNSLLHLPQDPHSIVASSSMDNIFYVYPKPMFVDTRTANSSPEDMSGLFRPSLSVYPSSSQQSTATIADASPIPTMPNSYRREYRQFEPSDLAFGLPDFPVSGHLAVSFPQSVNDRRGGFPPSMPTRTHQAFQSRESHPRQQRHHSTERFFQSADGYSSQPMTRNPSAQSQPEVGGITGSTSYAAPRVLSRPLEITPSRVAGSIPENFSYSHSVPVSSHSQPESYPGIGYRNSPASIVETEPSPKLASAFSDVNTSYRQWEMRHAQGESGYMFHQLSDSKQSSSFLAKSQHGQAISSGPVSGVRGHGGRLSRSRSDSLSIPASGSYSVPASREFHAFSGAQPTVQRLGLRSRSQSPSMTQRGAFTRDARSNPVNVYPSAPVGDAASPSLSTFDYSHGSEPMERSGSGRLKFGSGRIIPFGLEQLPLLGSGHCRDEGSVEGVVGLGSDEV